MKDILFDVIEEIDEAIGYQSDSDKEEKEENNHYINLIIYIIIFLKKF